MEERFTTHQPRSRVAWSRLHSPLENFGKGFRHAVRGKCADQRSVADHQCAELGAAEAARFFQDRIEHWREIAGRRIDDAENLGGGGLLGESLITLDRPLSQLPLRFVPFGSAFGKLTLQISYDLLGLG
jgi:hypothetical protein